MSLVDSIIREDLYSSWDTEVSRINRVLRPSFREILTQILRFPEVFGYTTSASFRPDIYRLGRDLYEDQPKFIYRDTTVAWAGDDENIIILDTNDRVANLTNDEVFNADKIVFTNLDVMANLLSIHKLELMVNPGQCEFTILCPLDWNSKPYDNRDTSAMLKRMITNRVGPKLGASFDWRNLMTNTYTLEFRDRPQLCTSMIGFNVILSSYTPDQDMDTIADAINIIDRQMNQLRGDYFLNNIANKPVREVYDQDFSAFFETPFIVNVLNLPEEFNVFGLPEVSIRM
jgi:hypothetical protein